MSEVKNLRSVTILSISLLQLLPLILVSQSSTNSVQLTYPVPVEILDSMTFEVKLGRQCAQTLKASQILNDSLTSTLNARDRLISLQGRQIASQNDLINGFPDQLDRIKAIGEIQSNNLKIKIKRLIGWIAGLASFDVIIVIYILLL